jgi:hypothetical protein
MKGNLDRHDLAQAEFGISLSVFVTIAEQLLMPQGCKNLAKIVHRAEKFF